MTVTLTRIGGRPLCWMLGHRVGPGQVQRDEERGRARLLRVSRCTRCGYSFAGEMDEPVAAERR